MHLHHLLRQLFSRQRCLLLGDGSPHCYVLIVPDWHFYGQISKWVCFFLFCTQTLRFYASLKRIACHFLLTLFPTDVELPPVQQKFVPRIDEKDVAAIAQSACFYANKAISL
jgi:hypothetical protein